MLQEKRNHKLKMLVFVTLLLVFSVGRVVLAAGATTNTSGTNLDEPFKIQGEQNMANLTQAIFEYAIALCVLAAAIYIAWGSLQYFLAAGNAKYAEEGKTIIIRAIQGLVLALVSWIILNTISTQFTQLKKPDGSGLQVKPAPNT
jgi:hypothetical protein